MESSLLISPPTFMIDRYWIAANKTACASHNDRRAKKCGCIILHDDASCRRSNQSFLFIFFANAYLTYGFRLVISDQVSKFIHLFFFFNALKSQFEDLDTLNTFSKTTYAHTKNLRHKLFTYMQMETTFGS